MDITPHEERKAVSFRFKEDIRNMLVSLSETTGRTQTYLAETAIEQFYDLQKWQINAIEAGIKEADAKKLIPHENVKSKWKNKHANSMD